MRFKVNPNPADLLSAARQAARPWTDEPGLYFLFDGDEVVYVGQSIHVPVRLYAHERSKKNKSPFNKQMQFTRMAYIVITDSHQLDAMETACIEAFQPRYNLQFIGSHPKPKHWRPGARLQPQLG